MGQQSRGLNVPNRLQIVIVPACGTVQSPRQRSGLSRLCRVPLATLSRERRVLTRFPFNYRATGRPVVLLSQSERSRDTNLMDILTEEAPVLTSLTFWPHDTRFVGRTAERALSKIRHAMKIALLATLLLSAAEGPATTAPVPEPLSIHEQIKADRARAKVDEENSPKSRHWDRDADGKRPWDSSKDIPRTKE